MSAQTVCQEQLVINNIPANGEIHGQSVTMTGCSGFFSSIELDRGDNGGAINGATLNIYNGESITDPPIYTQTNVVIPATSGLFTIDFLGGTGSLAFTEGNQYTFVIDNTPFYRLDIANGDLYSGGQLLLAGFFLSSYDWWFILNTSTSNPLGLNEYHAKNYILYPNPANDYIEISGLMQNETISIYSLLGSKVLEQTFKINERINIQNLTNGIYFIKFKNGNTLRFVKSGK